MLSNEVIGLLSLLPPWPATGSTSACTAAPACAADAHIATPMVLIGWRC
jgi:hypothetical protein